MSTLRDHQVQIVSSLLQAEKMLSKRPLLQDFFRDGHGLAHAAGQVASQMENLARQLRASSAALQAQACAPNTRPCPCCAGAGRKRREVYIGAGRYSDGGMVGCLTCDGRGEVAANYVPLEADVPAGGAA